MDPPNDKHSAAGAGSSSSFSERKHGHHRRRSSVNANSATLSEQRNGNFLTIQPRRANEHLHQPSLSPIPGTPSLSRSPSPAHASTWSSPAFSANHSHSGRSTPSQPALSPMPWEASKMRNFGPSPFPSFPSQSQGFFKRHMRRLSSSLPRFATHHAAILEKEQALQNRRQNLTGSLLNRVRRRWKRMGPRMRQRLVIVVLLWLLFHYLYGPLLYQYRRTSWLGGGEDFVILVPANKEGGVMDWKTGQSWAVERDSLRNKKRYVDRWGYNLEVTDSIAKRKYSHEWREGWEKVDKIRDTFKEYPDVEWIWWLDLNTVIMEPGYSLQGHIFKNLGDRVYRDINVYNPLNISHPFTDSYLDADAVSPVGDGSPDSINLILTQDCAGFSLGSFFIRRSAWTERLLDMWWDPVAYEQKHAEWTHQEQNALEYMYENQPWVRQHTAFLPQRMMNSYPQPACGDGTGKNNTMFHYDERDRDFVVNMAGCDTGRSCWAEMYHHRQYSYWLNRSWWEKFKEDFVAVLWFKMTGHQVTL